MRSRAYCLSVVCLFFVFSSIAQGQSTTDARAVLRRAIENIGVQKIEGKVIHSKAMHARLAVEQSDRTYPPYFPMFRSMEFWYNPSSNVERVSAQMTWFGQGPGLPTVSITGSNSAVMMRDTMAFPMPAVQNRLNILVVMNKWNQASDVRVAQPAMFRDYERTVLVMNTPEGEERLYIDHKSGLPVKNELVTPHYLWGQQHVEYVYSTWIQVGEIVLPAGSFKMVDGETEEYFTLGTTEVISASAAPAMTVPEKTGPPPPQMSALSTPADTVSVSKTAFLTRTRAYTEAIAFVNDTVYVFDATSGEQRAREDHQWVQKVFPGNYPIVVVVTDLAWPHISGVRYWVSQGATIVSHRMSEAFLRKVVDRKWTLQPDELEKQRAKSKFRFIGVSTGMNLAGGKIRLFPIDGPSSEGALIAYLSDDKLLWASDYIQNLRGPSVYAQEVMAAVKREGVKPEKVVAQHIPLIPWKQVEDLQTRK